MFTYLEADAVEAARIFLIRHRATLDRQSPEYGLLTRVLREMLPAVLKIDSHCGSRPTASRPTVFPAIIHYLVHFGKKFVEFGGRLIDATLHVPQQDLHCEKRPPQGR